MCRLRSGSCSEACLGFKSLPVLFFVFQKSKLSLACCSRPFLESAEHFKSAQSEPFFSENENRDAKMNIPANLKL